MKIALLSFITATLLGLASHAAGRSLDAADLTAILFATGLVAWTCAQYSRTPRVLTSNRPIHLPISPALGRAHGKMSRLAA